jgi:hypothetical protein
LRVDRREERKRWIQKVKRWMENKSKVKVKEKRKMRDEKCRLGNRQVVLVFPIWELQLCGQSVN